MKATAQYAYESEHLHDRIACFPCHEREDPTLSQICIFPYKNPTIPYTFGNVKKRIKYGESV